MAPGKGDSPSKHRMCDISSESTLDPQMFVHDMMPLNQLYRIS